ncbi:hypothetical protein FOZ63_008139 [Perkinsus olseni]|uniref:Protein kinase domain-containing protein n=1 Tax=Perkinsus olseni TaxID=32597 RepID=A0A7J6UR64_PEROL|nr:hypothetical protein FOZ63_008139 [Perkinsus olseni]
MSLASVSTASAGSSLRNPNDPRGHHQLVLHQPIHQQQQMHSLPECISAVPLELPGPIGRRFSLYPSVTQCILGSGSYAIVRQLKDRETGEYYALKAVQKQPLIDRGMLDRVYNEIATHQELKHENILTLYGPAASRPTVESLSARPLSSSAKYGHGGADLRQSC